MPARVFLSFLAACLCVLCTAGPINVAVLYRPEANGVVAVERLGRLWQQYVASIGGMGPGNQLVNISYHEVSPATAWDFARVRQVTQQLLDQGHKHLIAPLGTAGADVAILTVEQHSSPAIILAHNVGGDSVFECDSRQLPPCTESSGRRFTRLRGVSTLLSRYQVGFLNLMAIKQAQSVAFLHDNSSIHTGMCSYAVKHAQTLGMSTLGTEVIPEASTPDRSETLPAIRRAVTRLQQLAPDVVVGCTSSCDLIVKQFKENDFNVKAASFAFCLDRAVRDNARSELLYTYSPSQWDHRLSGPDFNEVFNGNDVAMYPRIPGGVGNTSEHSPWQFCVDYKANYGELPNQRHALMLLAFYALHAAVKRANSTDPTALLQHYDAIHKPTFAGLLASSHLGANLLKGLITWQAESLDSLEIVSPVQSSTAASVYPMPTWAERGARPEPFSRTSEQVVMALVAAVTIVCLVITGILFANRHVPIIRASSMFFVCVCQLGSVVSAVSVLTWPVENTAFTCAVRPWAMGLGIVLVLAPLAAKTYRIGLIFSSKLARHTGMSDQSVLLFMTVLITPQLLFLLVWALQSPLRPTLERPDKYRPALDVTVCSSSDSEVFVFLTTAYTGVLALISAVMAFHARHAWSDFTDARDTHLAVYAMCVFYVLLVVLGTTHPADKEAWFVLRSALVLVLIVCMQSLLFIPKVWAVREVLRKVFAKPASSSDITIVGVVPTVGSTTLVVPGAAPSGASTLQQTPSHASASRTSALGRSTADTAPPGRPPLAGASSSRPDLTVSYSSRHMRSTPSRASRSLTIPRSTSQLPGNASPSDHTSPHTIVMRAMRRDMRRAGSRRAWGNSGPTPGELAPL